MTDVSVNGYVVRPVTHDEMTVESLVMDIDGPWSLGDPENEPVESHPRQR
jgi:hypothetical protein